MAKPTVSIELDRKNRVFYPGETVQGTVRLVTDKETGATCQGGVFLDFQAKAATKWFEKPKGSSTGEECQPKKKKLFSGETVYQQEIRTLLGCAYETGALRTTGQKEGANFTGEAIDYTKVPGAGELYISCDAADKEKLKLRIDYNGAVAKVKLEQLAAEKGEIIPHYLTDSMDYMTRGPVNLSGEFVPYESIFPEVGNHVSNANKSKEDSTIKNNEIENLLDRFEDLDNSTKHDSFSTADDLADNKAKFCFVLRVHQLRGIKRGTKNVSVKVYDVTNVPESKPDTGKEYTVQLPKGVSTFPFSFKLREDAPGSARWKFGSDQASVTYSLNAYIGTGRKDSGHRIVFTVIPVRPLPRPALLSPYNMESGIQPRTTCGCFCRGTVYMVAIKLCLGRLAYAAGERIDFSGSTVTNNSEEAQLGQIVLRSYIEQDGGYRQKNKQTEDHVLFEFSIQRKKTVVITNLPEFTSVRVPPVFPSYSGVFLDPKKKNRLEACVKWTYTLEIRLPNWGNGFYCRTPFLIPSAPPYTYQLHEYRAEKSNPQLTSQWSIFEQAVSSSQKCDMGPTPRKPDDDKGKMVTAKGASPVWMQGDSDDYQRWLEEGEDQERLEKWLRLEKWNRTGRDEDYPDLVKLFHRNVVVVHAGPSRIEKVEQD